MSLHSTSRNTPPAHPVIMPLTSTMVSGISICWATWQPMMVNATRPMASSSRNRLRRRRSARAPSAVSSAAPAVIHRYSGWATQLSG
ncbi:Uncharacterised protein [Bordetella pertussis]|nr:Uncharacterised protein [Bordetella pertussis]